MLSFVLAQSIIALLISSAHTTIDYCLNQNDLNVTCTAPANNYCKKQYFANGIPSLVGEPSQAIIECAQDCQADDFTSCCSVNGCVFSSTSNTALIVLVSLGPILIVLVIVSCCLVCAYRTGKRNRQRRLEAGEKSTGPWYQNIIVKNQVGVTYDDNRVNLSYPKYDNASTDNVIQNLKQIYSPMANYDQAILYSYAYSSPAVIRFELDDNGGKHGYMPMPVLPNTAIRPISPDETLLVY